MKFLLFSGSFHSHSRSLALLNAVSKHLQDHSSEILKLDSLPFYCEDLNKNKPEAIQTFLHKVSAADGIICCTPEYNHSIPAVLKNAIDWASRPAFNSPLKDKPVSIISQAVSAVGGARAQAHLKLVLDSTLSDIHICHEMMVPDIDKVISDGMVTDPKTLDRLERHIKDFIRFIESRK